MTIVKVILRNRYAKFLKPYPKKEFRHILRYRFPGYFWSYWYRKGKWDGYLSMLVYHRVGTGLFLAMKDELEKEANIKFKVIDKRERVEYKKDKIVSDRKYQNECVDAMQECTSGGLVIKATAAGKTLTTGLFFRRVKGRCVFVVNELTLMDQAQKELANVTKEEIGTVGKGLFQPKRITVATVQTLSIHKDNLKFQEWANNLDVMIIDEVHNQINKRNIDVVKSMSPKLVIGLTATLELKKKPVRMRVFALAGEPIYEYPLEQGVEEGYLSPGVVVGVQFPQDGLSEKYQIEYEDMIVRNKARNRMICSLARECHAEGRAVVIIVERVKHLKKLSEMLQDIPHRTVFGEKDVEERIKSKDKFDKGKIRLLIVNKVFKQGISINAIDAIIEGSALKSKNDAIQKYGRGIRLGKNKDGLLYFDISDVASGDIENRFEKGTRSRMRAFKARGIRIKKIQWNANPEECLDLAKKQLKLEIKSKKG